MPELKKAETDLQGPLREALLAMEKVLDEEEAPHALVGAVASLLHGNTRTTMDVDFIPQVRNKEHLGEVLKAAEAEGFSPADVDDAWTRRVAKVYHKAGVKADLWLTAQEPGLGQEVVSRARPMWLGDREVQVATPEDIVLLKAIAWRPRDIEDATGVCTANAEQMDLQYMQDWAEKFGVGDRVKQACANAKLARLRK